MIDVVVVILLFDARVLDRPDLYLEAEAFTRPTHNFRELPDAIDLVQLVEDPIFSSVWWVFDSDRQALYRVYEGDEASSLSSQPIGAERVSNDGLSAKPVDNCAESLVKINPSQRLFILGLVGAASVSSALHYVRGSQPPDLARWGYIGRVVPLAQMIKASRLSRER